MILAELWRNLCMVSPDASSPHGWSLGGSSFGGVLVSSAIAVYNFFVYFLDVANISVYIPRFCILKMTCHLISMFGIVVNHIQQLLFPECGAVFHFFFRPIIDI